MSDTSNGASRNSFLSRACENCRLRKIRCDKAIPCSSCQTLGISCQAAARTTEHRPRVVISSQYEKQIELIQERLASIERSVREISRSATPATRSSPGNDLLSASANDSPATNITAFEGDSSFTTQTLQASEAADLTVARVLGGNSTLEVRTALSSLKNSLQTNDSGSRANEVYLSSSSLRSGPPDMTLPPVDLVVAVVRRIKVAPPFSLIGYCWRDLLQLETLCQKIYFPSEPVPHGSLTLMHGLLYWTLRDYSHEEHPTLAQWDLPTYAELCERNFSKGIETYEALVVPTLENIQCLLLAATKAQEQAKMQLVWTYVTAAHSMCQTLGFHRESFLKKDPPEVADVKRQAFWNLYMMDKNVSLNMGRPSNFHDEDIDVEYFTLASDPRQRPWDEISHISIKFATVQGEVYHQLYSISASKASAEQRLRAVEELSTKVIAFRNELVTVKTKDAYYASHLDSMVAVADFIMYTTLTVVYRAQTSTITGTEISSKCFEVARLSLQAHLRCFELFRSSNVAEQMDYVTWILLYPSFTPFVIHFTHAIATMDADDLALLRETTSTLEQVRHVSHGAKRLYEVCRAFMDTAEVLIQSRQTFTGMQQHDDGSLVFPAVTDPQVPGPAQDFSWPVWPEAAQNMDTNNMEMSMFLGNWLGANRPVMDMLNLDADHEFTM